MCIVDCNNIDYKIIIWQDKDKYYVQFPIIFWVIKSNDAIGFHIIAHARGEKMLLDVTLTNIDIHMQISFFIYLYLTAYWFNLTAQTDGLMPEMSSPSFFFQKKLSSPRMIDYYVFIFSYDQTLATDKLPYHCNVWNWLPIRPNVWSIHTPLTLWS